MLQADVWQALPKSKAVRTRRQRHEIHWQTDRRKHGQTANRPTSILTTLTCTTPIQGGVLLASDTTIHISILFGCNRKLEISIAPTKAK